MQEAMISVIDAIYASPQFQVRTAGKPSEAHKASAGIRQGCLLSPYLFLSLHSTTLNGADKMAFLTAASQLVGA